MGVSGNTIRVEGLSKLSRLIAESDAELDAFMREGLAGIAETVAHDVRSRYRPYSEIGASRVKAKVSKKGAALVVQTLRKSRNINQRRANFGSLMFRTAFLPAQREGEHKAEEATLGLLREMEARWR